ncbi:glycosyltransferase family 4 protein [Algoriphagus mannitolivorans]|uniref:glycosyltransferase family 4 protein n=1 Tax=Algoriphagus mannitolivorans TaxID=226504 RepID=UPI00047E1285|nr:glycosyltransferase family 4 protein [Algoriphagus mannitolivorans]
MHICFLSHEYPKNGLNPGGVGVFLRGIAPKIVQKGHQVTILGANNTDQFEEYEEEGVRIIRVENPQLAGINWFLIAQKLNFHLKRIHRETPLDIVEGSELSFAFLSKISGVKFVIRLHGGHYFFAESENRGINWWKGWQERKSFSKADGVIAVSDYVRMHTAKFHSIESYPIETIRYAIDTDKFYPRPEILPPSYSMVFLGTICQKKGVENLILAFAQVIKTYPNAKLDLYGKDWFYPDGSSYTQKMKTLIDRLDLIGSVRLLPPVHHDKVPETFAHYEYCIFPSFMETQGLVAPEAMAMEKVVIFTQKGPGPETITHLENGYLCDPLSVRNIEETILTAFENRNKNSEIGKNAKLQVLNTFSSKGTIDKNLNFYRRIIHG